MILMVQLSGELLDSFSGLLAHGVVKYDVIVAFNTEAVKYLFFSAAQSPILVADLQCLPSCP